MTIPTSSAVTELERLRDLIGMGLPHYLVPATTTTRRLDIECVPYVELRDAINDRLAVLRAQPATPEAAPPPAPEGAAGVPCYDGVAWPSTSPVVSAPTLDRLATLEAENAHLRAQLAQVPSVADREQAITLAIQSEWEATLGLPGGRKTHLNAARRLLGLPVESEATGGALGRVER